jgi:hypothetical protein
MTPLIKHGVKASGMPAWGKSMNDDYIWNLAAFLQALPKLDEAGYRTMVAQSGGHSHGGGETHGAGESRVHAASGGNHHHDHAEKPDVNAHAAGQFAGRGEIHTHPDGKQHKHSSTGDAQ